METFYKWLEPDGYCIHALGARWDLPTAEGPSEYLSVSGNLIPCLNGLHLCDRESLSWWIGPALFEAEAITTERINHVDPYGRSPKIVVRTARLTRRVDTWNDVTMRLFAADCAERVIKYLAVGDQPAAIAALEVSRRFALGLATTAELSKAHAVAEGIKRHSGDVGRCYMAAYAIYDATVAGDRNNCAAMLCCVTADVRDAMYCVSPKAKFEDKRQREIKEAAWENARLLRYIAGELPKRDRKLQRLMAAAGQTIESQP